MSVEVLNGDAEVTGVCVDDSLHPEGGEEGGGEQTSGGGGGGGTDLVQEGGGKGHAVGSEEVDVLEGEAEEEDWEEEEEQAGALHTTDAKKVAPPAQGAPLEDSLKDLGERPPGNPTLRPHSATTHGSEPPPSVIRLRGGGGEESEGGADRDGGGTPPAGGPTLRLRGPGGQP